MRDLDDHILEWMSNVRNINALSMEMDYLRSLVRSVAGVPYDIADPWYTETLTTYQDVILGCNALPEQQKQL